LLKHEYERKRLLHDTFVRDRISQFINHTWHGSQIVVFNSPAGIRIWCDIGLGFGRPVPARTQLFVNP
jgi:hypothetical protein